MAIAGTSEQAIELDLELKYYGEKRTTLREYDCNILEVKEVNTVLARNVLIHFYLTYMRLRG